MKRVLLKRERLIRSSEIVLSNLEYRVKFEAGDRL